MSLRPSSLLLYLSSLLLLFVQDGESCIAIMPGTGYPLPFFPFPGYPSYPPPTPATTTATTTSTTTTTTTTTKLPPYCPQCERCRLTILCEVCDDNCRYATNGDCLHCPKLVQHCIKTGLCNNCELNFALPHTQPQNGLKCTRQNYPKLDDRDMAAWLPLDTHNITTIL